MVVGSLLCFLLLTSHGVLYQQSVSFITSLIEADYYNRQYNKIAQLNCSSVCLKPTAVEFDDVMTQKFIRSPLGESDINSNFFSPRILHDSQRF